MPDELRLYDAIHTFSSSRKRCWKKYGNGFRVHIRYRKTVEERKDIETDFYANDSLNDNLESKF